MNTKRNFIPLLSKFISLLIFSFVIASCSNNNINTTSQITNVSINDTITLNQLSQDISYLASDELQGRDNFSPSINQAAEYIANRFNEVGLIPATKQTNYLQQYTIEQVIPKALTVEINGKKIPKERLAMASTVDRFYWDSKHLSNSAPLSKAPLNKNTTNVEFIPENMNMRKALKVLNNKGGEHLVLLHPKHRKSFKRYQSHFAKGSSTLLKDRSNLATEKGVIVIVLTNIDEVKKYQVNGESTIIQHQLSNVVGMIPGKQKPNEFVVYSAHYDHLGSKESNLSLAKSSNDIFNGANDDASGVAAIISLANHFTQMANNERTIIFVAFSAEELGGFGSRHFSSQFLPEQIIAMINIEMIGKPAIFGEGTVWMTGMERSDLGEQLNQTLESTTLKIYADPYPNEKLFYRSDNATLARLGVPAHSFSSTQLDKDKDYHQVSDTIDTLNIPSMLKVVRTLARATEPLIKGKLTPSRINPEKLRSQGKIY